MTADTVGMEPTLKLWGRQVAGARRQRGMTQLDLALHVGYADDSQISRLERGLMAPPDVVKWRICGALQEPVSYLFPAPEIVPSDEQVVA